MEDTTTMNDPASARRSPWPARLDLAQSLSGLFLALFMWLHMAFVSSILLGKDAFWSVARMFEGYFVLGRAVPLLVSAFVAAIFAIIVVHAALAMRKFPANWRQYRTFWGHMRGMAHGDTTLWLVQVVTGFAMFFLASVHLYAMMVEPQLIDPYGSADLVWGGRTWPLLIVLLLCVEVHGSVGLYRLALKWGWPTFGDAERTRRVLRRIMWGLIAVLIGLGFLSLSAFVHIGIAHAPHRGELYTPSWMEVRP
jgi:fumarate reductase subunit C